MKRNSTTGLVFAIAIAMVSSVFAAPPKVAEKSYSERIKEAIKGRDKINVREQLNEVEQSEKELNEINKKIAEGKMDAKEADAKREELAKKASSAVESALAQAEAQYKSAGRDSIIRKLSDLGVTDHATLFGADSARTAESKAAHEELMAAFKPVFETDPSELARIDRVMQLAAVKATLTKNPESRKKYIEALKMGAKLGAEVNKNFSTGTAEAEGAKSGDHSAGQGALKATGRKASGETAGSEAKIQFGRILANLTMTSIMKSQDPKALSESLAEIPANDKAVLQGLQKMSKKFEESLAKNGKNVEKAMEDVYKWLRDEVKLTQEELEILCGVNSKCPGMCKKG